MLGGLGLVATLTWAVPSAKAWLCTPQQRLGQGSEVPLTSMYAREHDSAVNVDEIWPHLKGEKTCADNVAGEVIREAWAKDQSGRGPNITPGQSSGSPSSSSWQLRRSVVDYSDGDMALQGLYARPEGEGLPERLPGVILAHTAVGPQEDMILWKLDAIARLGYAVFALDMFGTGHALWNRAQSLAARRPITEDRSLMQARAMAAICTLGRMEEVDQERLAAVGYCFGGMVVLDLARIAQAKPAARQSAAEGEGTASHVAPRLKAVASLHGILVPISPGTGGEGDASVVSDDTPVSVSRVLVLHATADPFVPPEQVEAMESEFLRRGANLEIVRYGGEAMHAFTRPEKTGQADRDAGLSYCRHADEDSWRRVVEMLREELK